VYFSSATTQHICITTCLQQNATHCNKTYCNQQHICNTLQQPILQHTQYLQHTATLHTHEPLTNYCSLSLSLSLTHIHSLVCMFEQHKPVAVGRASEPGVAILAPNVTVSSLEDAALRVVMLRVAFAAGVPVPLYIHICMRSTSHAGRRFRGRCACAIIYNHMPTYIYIYIYIYIYVYIPINVYMYYASHAECCFRGRFACTIIYTYMHIYMYTCICTMRVVLIVEFAAGVPVPLYMCTCIYVNIYICKMYTHEYIHVYMNIFIYTYICINVLCNSAVTG